MDSNVSVWPTRPVEATDADLTRIVGAYPVVVVDVYADWCGPCRMLAPTLDALASELAGKVVVAKLDADTNRAAGAMGVSALPTLVVFRNGRIVDRIVGARPKEMLREAFLAHVEASA